MNILYSFIIPHKNCPDLLNRCVNSIPMRDDVQIIVVDDNSNTDKKPRLPERKGLEVILLDENQSQGAGKARNVGIEHSIGKYLLFADSDDYYTQELSCFLDEMTETIEDVIYFKFETDNLKRKTDNWSEAIDAYMVNKSNSNIIRFSYWTPWNKMVNRSFVMNNSLCFETVPVGNDAFFSFSVGKKAETIACSTRSIYHYCLNTAGLTKQKRNFNMEMESLESKVKINKFKKDYNLPPIPIINIGNLFRLCREYGFCPMCRYIKCYLKMKKNDCVKFIF